MTALRQGFDRYWNTPFMDKWGRIILLFASASPFFFFFRSHPAQHSGTDQFILVSIIFALALGTILSTATTEKYYARSLGLYGIIVGSMIYYLFVLLNYRNHRYMVLVDVTRAIFLVSAWLFAIACLITWHQKRRTPREP
jgi:hypothetical protein